MTLAMPALSSNVQLETLGELLPAGLRGHHRERRTGSFGLSRRPLRRRGNREPTTESGGRPAGVGACRRPRRRATSGSAGSADNSTRMRSPAVFVQLPGDMIRFGDINRGGSVSFEQFGGES